MESQAASGPTHHESTSPKNTPHPPPGPGPGAERRPATPDPTTGRPATPDPTTTFKPVAGLTLRLGGTRPGTAASSGSDHSTPRAFVEDKSKGTAGLETTSPNPVALIPTFTTRFAATTLRPAAVEAVGFLRKTVQHFTNLFTRSSTQLESTQSSAPPPVFYNLDPSLVNTCGLKSEIMPVKTWGMLRVFCLQHDITQADLERLYKRFSASLESTIRPHAHHTMSLLEETLEQGLKRIAQRQSVHRKNTGKKLYTVSLRVLQADVDRSGMEEAVMICMHGINEWPVPQLAPMSPDEKKALELNFALFVIKAWHFCHPSEHDFLRLFFGAMLDKFDVEAYRPPRSLTLEGDDVEHITHRDFLRLLSGLCSKPPSYFTIIDDQIFPPKHDASGDAVPMISFRTLLHYCYIYPMLAVHALAAQQAVRRRIFGEAFWRQWQPEALPEDELQELLESVDLPPSGPARHSLTHMARVPDHAEAFTLKMLCRSIYFQRDEEAIFGPQEVNVPSLLFTLRTHYGNHEAERLLRRGLGVGEEPFIPSDHHLDRQTSKDGWVKILDPKHQVHFFYNPYTGESTWDPPRHSKYFRTYVEENKNGVPMAERKVKVSRLLYYDDPILVERREEARRARMPKAHANMQLLRALGKMRRAAWKTVVPLASPGGKPTASTFTSFKRKMT